MRWLAETFVGNWMVYAVVFALGVGVGAVPAWKYQGERLEAVQVRYDSFVAQTKIIGEQAKKDADAANASYQKTLEDVSHAWEKQLPAVRDSAVAAYISGRAFRVSRPDPGGSQVPGPTGSTQGTNAASQECVPDENLIRDAAEDALKIGSWQTWATANGLPVK